MGTSHCPNGYQCNAHICTADEGKALLKSIKVYSTSCTDCTTEGLIVTLNGRQDVVNKVQCRTNNLDHGGQVDYDAGDALFDDSEWKWTGSGSWEGSAICVEWFGGDVYASSCSVVAGGMITDCVKIDGVTCP